MAPLGGGSPSRGVRGLPGLGPGRQRARLLRRRLRAQSTFGLRFVGLPTYVLGYGTYAVIAYGTGWALVFRRAPTRLRACSSVVLLLVVLALLTWWCFATAGTPAEISSYAGTCPPGNIPPWWPDWIPA